MTNYYQEILSELKKSKGDGSKLSGNDSYLSSGHKYLFIRNPRKYQIARFFLNQHRDLSFNDFIALLDELYNGQFYEEKTITGQLLKLAPKYRQQLRLSKLDNWLEKLNGWAEVDSTSQGVFTADEILDRWTEWSSFLLRLATDTNINKRRASIVLLTSPLTQSEDKRLRELAFINVEKLKTERDILISKAVSWVLRSLVRHHRPYLIDYLKEASDSLPKIAIRETKNKLETGKK